MAYDEKLAERIRHLTVGRRDIVEKKMMGGLTFMTEGGMFCSASGKGGLLVRVDPDARDRFLGEDHVKPADIGGRRMTGFVRVAAEGYRTEAALKKWVERGLAGIAARPAAKSPASRKAVPNKAPGGISKRARGR